MAIPLFCLQQPIHASLVTVIENDPLPKQLPGSINLF